MTANIAFRNPKVPVTGIPEEVTISPMALVNADRERWKRAEVSIRRSRFMLIV